MPENTSVSIPGMQAAEAQIEQTKGTLNNLAQQMEGAKSRLFAGGWTGGSADTFNVGMGYWNQHFTEILTALGSLQRGMAESVENYSKTHNMATQHAEQASQQLQNATTGLPGL
ncbi:WXG100 family type VII secretion target [Amycolatopsis japonica]